MGLLGQPMGKGQLQLQAAGGLYVFDDPSLEVLAYSYLRPGKQVEGSNPRRPVRSRRSQRMTEHYSHVDVSEKKAAVEGMLKLVKGGRAAQVAT